MSNEELDRERRRRRWYSLAEDGEMFGLTHSESVELAQLEQEFGKTNLPEDMRS